MSAIQTSPLESFRGWVRLRIVVFSDGRQADGEPPTISDFAPPPGSVISQSSALAFSVRDLGRIVRYYIAASFRGHPLREVVYDGAGFAPLYRDSARESIQNGSRFTIRRTGDWPVGASPTLHIEAIDAAGNVSVLA